MGQSQPISDSAYDLFTGALTDLESNLESVMRAYERGCDLSLRRHVNDAENTLRLVSDCPMSEPEYSALMLECLAGYIRVRSYLPGDYPAIVPAMLKTVLEAHPRP